jgi:hypothetical protein
MRVYLELITGTGIEGGSPSAFESNNASGARFATMVFASSFCTSLGAFPESHFLSAPSPKPGNSALLNDQKMYCTFSIKPFLKPS